MEHFLSPTVLKEFLRYITDADRLSMKLVDHKTNDAMNLLEKSEIVLYSQKIQTMWQNVNSIISIYREIPFYLLHIIGPKYYHLSSAKVKSVIEYFVINRARTQSHYMFLFKFLDLTSQRSLTTVPREMLDYFDEFNYSNNTPFYLHGDEIYVHWLNHFIYGDINRIYVCPRPSWFINSMDAMRQTISRDLKILIHLKFILICWNIYKDYYKYSEIDEERSIDCLFEDHSLSEIYEQLLTIKGVQISREIIENGCIPKKTVRFSLWSVSSFDMDPYPLTIRNKMVDLYIIPTITNVDVLQLTSINTICTDSGPRICNKVLEEYPHVNIIQYPNNIKLTYPFDHKYLSNILYEMVKRRCDLQDLRKLYPDIRHVLLVPSIRRNAQVKMSVN